MQFRISNLCGVPAQSEFKHFCKHVFHEVFHVFVISQIFSLLGNALKLFDGATCVLHEKLRAAIVAVIFAHALDRRAER